MMSEANVLRQLIANNKLIPFIGAGFSENAGLPSTQALTRQLLEHFEPDLDGQLHSAANLLYLTEYLKIIHGGSLTLVLDALRSCLPDQDVALSGSHQLLAQLGFSIIYTTNYDRLLERSFAEMGIPYKAMVTADIIQSTGCKGVQIISFSWLFEVDDSILTECDYYMA